MAFLFYEIRKDIILNLVITGVRAVKPMFLGIAVAK